MVPRSDAGAGVVAAPDARSTLLPTLQLLRLWRVALEPSFGLNSVDRPAYWCPSNDSGRKRFRMLCEDEEVS